MSARMLTVLEVADLLNCSERYVKDELRRKNLRGSKTPNWVIDPDDLQAYIDRKANVRPVGRAS